MGSNCRYPPFGVTEPEQNVRRIFQSEGKGLSLAFNLFDFVQRHVSPVSIPQPPALERQSIGVELDASPEEAAVLQGKGSGAERNVGEGEEHGTRRERET